ncbi:MAG TPA: hypothetical protein VGL64_13405 [Amycolatopsis sp.]
MMGEVHRRRLEVVVLVVLGLAGLAATLVLIVDAFLSVLFRPAYGWAEQLRELWPWLLPAVLGLVGAFALRRREFVAAFVVLLVIDVVGLFGPDLLDGGGPSLPSAPVSSAVR